MKLIYRIILRLSLILMALLAIWASIFYFMMVDEINDEADDALEDYSELIIIRTLAGKELPALDNGSNNSYSITPVSPDYAATHPQIHYRDAEIYIPEKKETEPARILSTIFMDNDDNYFALQVAMPTFEKEDLFETILIWMVILYFILLLTVIGVTMWIFNRNMRPLYELLQWLDQYTPGRSHTSVPNNTTIPEFQKLNMAAQQAVTRSEELFEQQNQFIGNASHELQTPLAVLGNRLEWLVDNTELSEEQLGELMKMHHTLGHIVRLNKTLLLLTKIENGQFPESSEVNLAEMLREQVELYTEIYEERELSCTVDLPDTFVVSMNESLASVLTTNLLKNAFVHARSGSHIEVSLHQRTLTIGNDGTVPLDAEHIFERFYQGSKKEGSTGLGLALVQAIGRYYHLKIDYQFAQSKHLFSVTWK